MSESLIDATRAMLKALKDELDRLEAVWRSSATTDQLNANASEP